MHGPSLSGHWYPARHAATTVDPEDSAVNAPFLVDDSLLLFSQPNAKPSQSSDAETRREPALRDGRPAGQPARKSGQWPVVSGFVLRSVAMGKPTRVRVLV